MKWVLIALAAVVVAIGAVILIGAMLPKGHVASRSSRFRQPPEAVWAVITGPSDLESRYPEFGKTRAARRTPGVYLKALHAKFGEATEAGD